MALALAYHHGVETHYLHPGNLFAHKNPYIVTTILGSCVSTCLWDPILKIGGINHYLLPLWNGEGLASPRFGNIAIIKLIEKMERLGSNRKVLQAKVFGGAAINSNPNGLLNVGSRNVDVAMDMLAKENVRILSSDLKGLQGRRILYDTATGKVKLRYIQKTTGKKI